MNYTLFIGTVGTVIDILGVLAITFGSFYSVIDYCLTYIGSRNGTEAYQLFRLHLGRTIIIGLELLIAGDIVRSIAVPPSFTTVGVLAVVVLIRAFLSMQIEHGTEWHLPWKKEKAHA